MGAQQTQTLQKLHSQKWVRSQNGIFAGVCEGLGKSFDIDPWLIRLVWLASILALGTGFLVYLIFAFCLPREDRLYDAEQNKLLGVCYRISQSTGLDVGLVRAGAIMLALASLGTTVIGYFIRARSTEMLYIRCT